MTDQSYPVEHGVRSGETILLLHGNSVANWMWDQQVTGLSDRHVLTPDLPGLGARYRESWPGLPSVADELAQLVRERAVDGRAHVVGLSLGGFAATHLAQRHPAVVRSCLVTGVALAGLGQLERAAIAAQVPLWTKRWYWTAQALAFRIPRDDRKLFADTASRVKAETNHRTFAEVSAGAMPQGPFTFDGPFLAIAGEKEARSIVAGFTPLRQALPHLQTWIAPGMHHPWNIENPELFTQVVRTFADTGRPPSMG